MGRGAGATRETTLHPTIEPHPARADDPRSRVVWSRAGAAPTAHHHLSPVKLYTVHVVSISRVLYMVSILMWATLACGTVCANDTDSLRSKVYRVPRKERVRSHSHVTAHRTHVTCHIRVYGLS